MSTFGGRLRAARKSRGFSQTDLSNRSGIPKPTLSRYENDHVSPSLSTLGRLADALDVAPSVLFRAVQTPDDAFMEMLHDRGVTFGSVAEAQRAASTYADEHDASEAQAQQQRA